MNRKKFLASVFLCFVSALSGCSNSAPSEAAAAEELVVSHDHIAVGPITLAEFSDGFAIHGVGGDTAVLFAVQPTDSPERARGIHAARRVGGHVLADVTPPPEGWGTPLSIKIEWFRRTLPLGSSEGQFLVLDNRVPPLLMGTVAARLYRYSYRFQTNSGLTTTLRETHVLPLNTQALAPGNLPDGLAYPGSIALLPGGRVAVTDNAWGSVWVSDASLDSWSFALIDPRFAGAVGGTIEGVGLDADGNVSPYTLVTPAPPFLGLPPGLGLYPGAHSIAYAAYSDEVCFAVTLGMNPVLMTPSSGLYCIERAALLDTNLPPFAKSGDFMAGTWGLVRPVVPPTPGLGDLTDGVDYDRFTPDSPWLYWQRAPADVAGGGCNRLRRVHLDTLAVQELACDNETFAWANEISALPPIIPGLGVTTILSSVGQEYNNPDVNALLNGVPRYFAPSPLPVTLVVSY
ncbi:hypothetical protein M0Q28_04700 [Patescibacteria group bacterium]|jgi:hypothetical protein|nr:hypothetical protein [Patescibacteria group bacterium]